MRIERISKNTVNVYISHSDLAVRHLSFASLQEDSPDYTRLVWDAIDHANIELGHVTDDRQLRVVNKFDSDGCLVLTISQTAEDEPCGNPFSDDECSAFEYYDSILKTAAEAVRKDLGMPSKKATKQGIQPSYDEQNNKDASFHALFNKFKSETGLRRASRLNQEKVGEPEQNRKEDDSVAPESKELPPERINPLLPNWDIIVFPVFADMVRFFLANQNFKRIASSLYGYRGAYYLLLKPNSKNVRAVEKLEALVVDYNATYLPAEAFLPLLLERGTLISESGAISKLIKHFS